MRLQRIRLPRFFRRRPYVLTAPPEALRLTPEEMARPGPEQPRTS
ncbi:hypothetical protein [Streptomyces sp. NRRL WC-3742]|nr:hypothetical protein [Streptomyces sp. NRRL WC-3742]